MTTEDVIHDFFIPAFRIKAGRRVPASTRRYGLRRRRQSKFDLCTALSIVE